jgi:anti-sigma regulatory factor (Ser/Thr protein kinase)
MFVDGRTAMTRVEEATVVLTIPAYESYVRLVRLVAASSAEDCGYSFDGVEGVRIAADEAATLAVDESHPGGLVRVGVSATDRAISIAVECPTGSEFPEFDRLSSHVVAALTTTCNVSVVSGELRIFLQCRPA